MHRLTMRELDLYAPVGAPDFDDEQDDPGTGAPFEPPVPSALRGAFGA